MIKVLLLERVLILSNHLEEMLNQDKEIQVIETFTDGNEILKFLEGQWADVVVIDYQQTNGLVVADEIRKRHPKVKVVGFTTTENPSTDKIIDLGACCCLSKYNTTINELITNISDCLSIT